jgi:predicted Zn-dependent peptidase
MLNRQVAPAFVQHSTFSLIAPEESTLSNGVRVFFVPGGSQEVLKIELVFEAGKWFEERIGVAYFSSQLLSKGTAGKSSFEIAQLFDQYGAHLEITPGTDFVSVSLYALGKKLSPVLDLLIEILSSPSFPEKEFRQSQAVFIQNLKVNNEKTSYIASKLFRRNLFGKDHPYGSEIEETDVEELNVRDLKTHFNSTIHSAQVFVSGQINPDNKDRILLGLARLRKGDVAKSPTHAVHAAPKHERVEKKDSVQASIRAGHRSVLRSHHDYVSILFVCHILGGYFGSRLMKNIREEKGLTYGISASLHAMRHDSYLIIGADINKENVDVAFTEIRKELKKLRETAISSAELETTRNHFIGSLQSEITTPFAHADKIKAITLFDLRPDHYQQMIKKIEDLTPAEISRTSEAYFHEELFYETAVG